MNRRRLLGHVGAGAAAALGGCLAGIDASGDPERTDPPGEPEGTGSPASDSRPCPPYSTTRDRVVCSHTVDADAASVYLDANPDSGVLDDGTPVDEVTLTLYNQSTADFGFNPHSWRIRRRADSGWTELERHRVGDGGVSVPPDGTHTWSFLDAVESIRDDPELHPGLYAAEIGVPDPDAGGEWIACIALVRFEPSE